MHDSKYRLLRDKYIEELTHLSDETRKGYRSAINNFVRFLKFKDTFERKNIINYSNSTDFKDLEISSQNSYKHDKNLKKMSLQLRMDNKKQFLDYIDCAYKYHECIEDLQRKEII